MADNTREIALLLDWENIRFGLSQRNLAPNISAIREEAASLGRVVIARAYGDFQNRSMYDDPSRLYAAGIEPVYVPGRFYQNRLDGEDALVRKNSVDVKLTADCVEFCHRYPDITAYMLVSGDGDFIHLVNTLRPYGKFVAIIALSWSASQRLMESADLVRYYDRDVEPSAGELGRTFAPEARIADALPSGDMSGLFEEIREIVEERDGPLVLAALKPMLSARVGEFDERAFGHAKFKQLMMQAEREGYVRLITEGLVDWVIPAGAEPDAVVERDEADGLEFDSVRSYYVPPAGSQDSFEMLPENLRHQIIRFSNSLDLNSRYVTFRYLSQNLSEQPWMHLDYSGLVSALNSAVDMGLFTRNTYEDFNVHTGMRRELPTLDLNLDHPQVVEALDWNNVSSASGTSPD